MSAHRYPRLIPSVAVVAVALLALVAVRALSMPGPAQPQVNPTGAAPTSCEPGEAGRKTPLSGIVTIGALPKGRVESFVGGVSVNVPWADLEPTEGAPLTRPNAIDEAVDAVRRAGSGADCARGVKVRVLAGVHSPEWAKGLDGPSLALTQEQEGLSGTVPRFWTERFGLAYAALQDRLAEAYDGVAEVREVVISRCMTFYAEPLLRQATNVSNASALSVAGLDESADRACLRAQIEAHAVWASTPSSLALNPYVGPMAPSPEGSLLVTLDAADYCRATLGQRCILANNSIRWPPLGRRYLEMYEAMEVLGAPLEFQTAAPRRIGDVMATVQWAVERGAGSVELEPVLAVTARKELAAIADSSGWRLGG
jgi:hypothetical protein